MRSVSLVFARNLLLTGDSAAGFRTQWPRPAARINMLDRFDVSDKKLRDALDSSP